MARKRLRLPLLLLLMCLVVAGLSVPGNASSGFFPARIDLPAGFQPEGIAIGSRPFAFLGSRVDGDIYRVNLLTGQGKVITENPGAQSLGMKVGRQHRLFVAGGSGGDGRVVDTRSGEVLAEWTFASAPTFVNDVVLTRKAAWFTDSQKAVLYRVPLGHRLAKQADVRTVPLGGKWVQAAGTNANGIAQTPDRRALLVINSGSGLLFRVNPWSGVATQVDLGGTPLTNGDGLLLKGRTLYVVQNRLNQIAVVHLSRDGKRGSLVDTLRSPDFDVPTTVALFGRWLYLPNARFGNTLPEPKNYWITRIGTRAHPHH
jgi:sugar lactone lactonase YvrE